MKKLLFTNSLLRAMALIPSYILAIGIASCSNMDDSNAITLQEFDAEIAKIGKEVENSGEYQNFGAIKSDEFEKRANILRECVKNCPKLWEKTSLESMKQLLFSKYDECIRIISEDMTKLTNDLSVLSYKKNDRFDLSTKEEREEKQVIVLSTDRKVEDEENEMVLKEETQKIFLSGGLPKSMSYKDKEKIFTCLTLYEGIKTALINKNFCTIDLDIKYCIEQDTEALKSLFFDQKNVAIFFFISYSEDLDMYFDDVTCKVMPIFSSNEKWSTSQQVSLWSGEERIVEEMSLEYIEHLLLCRSSSNRFLSERKINLFKEIQKNNVVEKVINRFCLVFNSLGGFKLSSIASSAAEEERHNLVLNSIAHIFQEHP